MVCVSLLCSGAGQMWVWGSNRYGQLGIGPRDDGVVHVTSPHPLPQEVRKITAAVQAWKQQRTQITVCTIPHMHSSVHPPPVFSCFDLFCCPLHFSPSEGV